MFYLLKLVRDHRESLENGVRRPGDGDYPLRTVPLWDVDAGAALDGERNIDVEIIMIILIKRPAGYERQKRSYIFTHLLHGLPFLEMKKKEKKQHFHICVIFV